MKVLPAVVSTVTVPGSLLSQYKLLCAVIDAPWATRLDHKITRHVIERYWVKHGNARASLRYLEVATGATRTNIIESLRRVIDKGVFSIVRQDVGTRPTEYDLNFDFASKVPSGIAGDTSTRLVSVAKRIKVLQIAGFLRFMDMIFLDLNMCVASHVCL
jgi:hypothetical protein